MYLLFTHLIFKLTIKDANVANENRCIKISDQDGVDSYIAVAPFKLNHFVLLEANLPKKRPKSPAFQKSIINTAKS